MTSKTSYFSSLSTRIKTFLVWLLMMLITLFFEKVADKFGWPDKAVDLSGEWAGKLGKYAPSQEHLEFFIGIIVGPFGWGFLLASFLFSLPDWPKVRRWVVLRRWRKLTHTQAFALEKSVIDPLASNFEDKVIDVNHLQLPGVQLHEKKRFKNCRIMGPGAMIVAGGRLDRVTWSGCGDLIPIDEGALITGIPVLNDCTFEEVSIHKVLVLMYVKMINEVKRNVKADGGWRGGYPVDRNTMQPPDDYSI